MNAEAAVNRLLDVSSRRGLRRALVSAVVRVPVKPSSSVLMTPHRATQPNPPRVTRGCPLCGAVR